MKEMNRRFKLVIVSFVCFLPLIGVFCQTKNTKQRGISTKSNVISSIKSSYNIIVAGAGTGGWATAIQSARMGNTVLLLEETDWIGGQMTAAGVSTMDEGTIDIRNHGIYTEFYNRTNDYYRNMNKTVGTVYYNARNFGIEPHVAQKILYQFIDETNALGVGKIDVSLYSKIESVDIKNNNVEGVGISVNKQGEYKKIAVKCKILVDATEYGDVIPLTGAKYRIAKCTSDNIDSKALIQDFTWTAIVKEYIDGIPSKLKMEIAPPGYNSKNELNRFKYIRLNVPNKYNVYSNPTSWNTVAHYRGLPNSETTGIDNYTTKTSLNIAQNDVSTKVEDTEDTSLRWKKDVELRLKTLNLLYYFQKELGLKWSVATIEGYDTPYNKANVQKMIQENPQLKPYEEILIHFPIMPYVRESRRMIGTYTLVSADIDRVRGIRAFKDVISINDYAEDLHGSKKAENMDLDVDPKLHDEGWHVGPFQIPFSVFIPEKIDGFLVAEKNFSQSRLVNGATRLQPSTMLNGQAVGNIASLAIKNKIQPRKLDPVLVQKAQLDAKAPLFTKVISDIPVGSDLWKAVQLCLVHGMIKLDNNRYFPEDPMTMDEIEKIIQDNKITGLKFPDGVITKSKVALLLSGWLIEKAKMDMK